MPTPTQRRCARRTDQIHGALRQLANASAPQGDVQPTEEFRPAVSVRRSLASKDHIISMIDGKPYKALKRHLAAQGLTSAQYRERYGLKPDYPMVAPNYGELRRNLARQNGLGRKPAAAPKPAAKPARAKLSLFVKR